MAVFVQVSECVCERATAARMRVRAAAPMDRCKPARAVLFIYVRRRIPRSARPDTAVARVVLHLTRSTHDLPPQASFPHPDACIQTRGLGV